MDRKLTVPTNAAMLCIDVMSSYTGVLQHLTIRVVRLVVCTANFDIFTCCFNSETLKYKQKSFGFKNLSQFVLFKFNLSVFVLFTRQSYCQKLGPDIFTVMFDQNLFLSSNIFWVRNHYKLIIAIKSTHMNFILPFAFISAGHTPRP